MNNRLDPPADVERRLERRPTSAPSPALRARVLAAVDDVLHEKHVHSSAGSFEAVAALLAATAGALALSLLLVMMMPGAAVPGGPRDRQPALSLVDRARAAGIILEENL